PRDRIRRLLPHLIRRLSRRPHTLPLSLLIHQPVLIHEFLENNLPLSSVLLQRGDRRLRPVDLIRHPRATTDHQQQRQKHHQPRRQLRPINVTPRGVTLIREPRHPPSTPCTMNTTTPVTTDRPPASSDIANVNLRCDDSFCFSLRSSPMSVFRSSSSRSNSLCAAIDSARHSDVDCNALV